MGGGLGCGGGGKIFRKKALRRCKVQCYLRYEGVGGDPISTKKRYVTLEWPHTVTRNVGMLIMSAEMGWK